MAENKVNFGLKNVYFAPYEIGVGGNIVYEKPIPMKGAVNLELSPNDSSSTFFADNSAYYVSYSGGGQYEGSIEIANIPQEFLVKCLGEKVNSHNLLAEGVDGVKKNFALLFQVDGDKRDSKYCYFNCAVSRPTISASTTTESAEPNTAELSFTAIPRDSDGLVKIKTTETTTQGVHDSWYERIFDGILNSVDRDAPAFDKEASKQADIVETIITTGGAKAVGLKMNGIVVQTGDGGANWSYADNKFTIKKALLNTLEVGKHLLIIQMDKGNNISIDLEVKDTTVKATV